MKKIGLFFCLMLISCLISFYQLNGVYFLLSIPLLAISLYFDKKYTVGIIIGMFGASLFLDYRHLPICLLFSTIISAAFLFVARKNKMSVKAILPLTAFVYTLSLCALLNVYNLNQSLVNVFLMPFIIWFICYQLVDIRYDLISRESFSITKKQLYFMAFLTNFYLSALNFNFISFSVGLVVISCLNYMFIKLDPVAGVFGCLSALFLNISNGPLVWGVVLAPLILVIKFVRENQYLKGVIYFLLNLSLFAYFKDTGLLMESLFVSVFIVGFPNKLFNHMNKYVVEPQDYELKLYQQSYYKCLNRNKRIQKVMGLLENQMKNNPKMKKNSRELLHKNMQFLTNKLKEEENIRIKDIILNDYKYQNIEILSMRLFSDYFANYQIDIETTDNSNNDQEIIGILQEHLQAKLSIVEKKCNKLLGTKRYSITNDEKTQFNFLIKQRSKEMSMCGDSYVSFSVKNKKYLLISDGMGHGSKANKQATDSLLLLKEFIELGMNAKDAIVSCNALLYDKDSESFNTLDLLEYDIYDNQLFLYKNGSGCTYLKNTNGVEKINSENLPLGIVEEIKVEKIKIDLDVEYIVLTSDGFKKDLSAIINANKYECAKDLTRQIFEYEGNSIEDDQTIALVSVINLN